MIGELRLLYVFCTGEAGSAQALARFTRRVRMFARRSGGTVDRRVPIHEQRKGARPQGPADDPQIVVTDLMQNV